MSLKILQINIRVNKGSVSRITEQIGLAVLNQGWDSYIAYGRPSNASESQLIQIGTFWGVKWHYLMSLLTGRHGRFSTFATKKLIKQIRIIKPDVIHLQNIHGYYINYKVLFEYLNSINTPVVWTLHDCWSFTGHCSHFVTAKCNKWKTGCNKCPLKKAYPRSLFFDNSKSDYLLKKTLFTGKKNIHLVPVSYWLEEFVKKSYFKDVDIRVIQNGIDLNVFYPRKHVESNQTRLIGVASVWNKDKGLYDFYKLRDILSPEDFSITLIGLSPEQVASLPEKITGIERTSSVNELAEYYSNADIFVNLTYADTFPTVNIEALACGTPVVTYKTGGSPEILDDETGIVVGQGDIEGVACAVKNFREKKAKEIEAQRILCRQRAEKHYERTACFNNYIKLYKELCGLKN